MRNFLLLLAVAALVMSIGAKPEIRSFVIEASGDAYVVADLTPAAQVQTAEGMVMVPSNPLMDQNFGQVAFLRIWYNFLQPEEQRLLSMGLIQFDLEPLKGLEIESVSLQAYGLRSDLTQPARLVDAAIVQDDWAEEQVTYNTRPAWGTSATATSAVFGPNRWYSWDVTADVAALTIPSQSAQPTTASFVLILRASQDGDEEQVLFVSKEAGQNAPRLVVTYNYQLVVEWWVWATGIGVAALLAFIIGILVSRRTRPSAPVIIETPSQSL